MKKIFETLKRSKIFPFMSLVVMIATLIFAIEGICLTIHKNDVDQKATIEELQTANEKLRAEKETNEKKWQEEKAKLEEENKKLEDENEEISSIADAQLDRILLLPRLENEDDLPLVGIMEEFPFLGYLADTKEKAKTINLKAGYSRVLLGFAFSEATKNVLLTTPKGQKLDMVIRKNTIFIPLTKKGIYMLEISFKDGNTQYLALNWMGKIKTK